jgi:hypothetical protein
VLLSGAAVKVGQQGGSTVGEGGWRTEAVTGTIPPVATYERKCVEDVQALLLARQFSCLDTIRLDISKTP